jgi:hypothetical protein
MQNEQVLKTVEAVGDLVNIAPARVLREDLHDLFIEWVINCEPVNLSQKTRFTTLYRALRDFLGRVDGLDLYNVEIK